MNPTFRERVLAARPDLASSSGLLEALDDLGRALRSDLAPPAGGTFTRDSWAAIEEKAAALLAERLPAGPARREDLTPVWRGIAGDFHRENQWGHRPPAKPEPRTYSPETKEMLPYLWALVQAAFVMKIVIYYFGLKKVSDPSVTHDLMLYLALAFSFFSLMFFAWRMHRKESRKDPDA